jgi:hypothetical protein
MTDEPVFDKWGARIPDTVLNSVAYRMAQKAATAPKVNVTTGRPLPIEQQPEVVVAANPHLVPTADGLREAAVRRVGATLGIDPAAMLDSQSFMARVSAVDPGDVPAMTAAISEGIMENPSLVATTMAVPGLKPNPAQGTSGNAAPVVETPQEKARRAITNSRTGGSVSRIV